jgi:hypothetical protein
LHLRGDRMRQYAELLSVGSGGYEWHIYEQPFWRHALSTAYQTLWEPYTRALMMKLDRPANRLHHLRCKDDCMKGTKLSSGEDVRLCGRIPLDARQDLRVYLLSNARRRHLAEVPATRAQALDVGWPDGA